MCQNKNRMFLEKKMGFQSSRNHECKMLRFSLTMRSLRKLCFHGLVDSVHKVLPQMFPSSRGLFFLVSGGQEEKSPPHTREKRPLLAGKVKCKGEAIFMVKSRVKSKRL